MPIGLADSAIGRSSGGAAALTIRQDVGPRVASRLQLLVLESEEEKE